MRPLTRKERRLALAAAIIVIMVLAYNHLISPSQERIDTLQRIIPEKQQELIDVTQTSQQIARRQKQLKAIEANITHQPDDFSPQTWIKGVVDNTRLNQYSNGITQNQRPLNERYLQTTLTLELQGINLKQLTSLLAHLENPPGAVTLQNLSLTSRDSGLDATLIFSHLTYQ